MHVVVAGWKFTSFSSKAGKQFVLSSLIVLLALFPYGFEGLTLTDWSTFSQVSLEKQTSEAATVEIPLDAATGTLPDGTTWAVTLGGGATVIHDSAGNFDINDGDDWVFTPGTTGSGFISAVGKTITGSDTGATLRSSFDWGSLETNNAQQIIWNEPARGGFKALVTVDVAAPGGIDTNLQLWLRADEGVVGGATVDSWADQSGANNNFGATGTARPDATENTINFNPSVTFDGSNDAMFGPGNAGILQDTSGLDVYMIARTDGTKTTTFRRALYEGGNNVTSQSTFAFSPDNSAAALMRAFGSGEDSSLESTTESVSTENFPTMYQGRLDDAADTLRFLVNAEEVDSVAFPTNTRSAVAHTMVVGAGPGGVSSYPGDIAEVIVYDADNANTTDRQKIQSYLALKYGVTLGPVVGTYKDSTGVNVYTLADQPVMEVQGLALVA